MHIELNPIQNSGNFPYLRKFECVKLQTVGSILLIIVFNFIFFSFGISWHFRGAYIPNMNNTA